MNLFDIIPENYFSIFSGKNRSIYATSLLTLYELLENDESFIQKQDFIKALKDKGGAINDFSYDEEELDDNDEDNLLLNSISTKAAFIIRRLEETGWFDVTIDPDTQEEIIILPMQSMIFLKAMKDIISDEQSPYLSLVHSTYSELKVANDEQDELMYVALSKSFDNTKKLKVELNTLSHSIRIFQNKLGKIFQTNAVLHDYFDVYKSKVIDRFYHPLKTFDSVVKFKRPIIKILDDWTNNREILNKLIEQAQKVNPELTPNGAEVDVIAKINYISDTFDTIGQTISSIDKDNNAYTKSSANKILYLNNTDKTIKGHLENIFKAYARSINDFRTLATILSKMQNCSSFYEQGFIDSNSVTLPFLRKYRVDGSPLEVFDFDTADDEIMESFLQETQNIYTDQRIYEFMAKAFGDKNDLNIREIKLLNDDAFICLILATIRKEDPSCFYEVEEIDTSKVYSYGYIVPNFIFHKKANNEQKE